MCFKFDIYYFSSPHPHQILSIIPRNAGLWSVLYTIWYLENTQYFLNDSSYFKHHTLNVILTNKIHNLLNVFPC